MSEQPDATPHRLNKHLALQLGVSRRQADDLIDQGRVTINGQPVSLGARFANGDVVAVDGQPLAATAQLQYILLNKPIGYVCSRRRQGDSPTVYDLLPADLHDLKLVGRLDRDSSGLIMLTNDGDFAYQMTHPKFYKVKVYQVTLDRDLQPLHQQMISDYGIQLEDGVSKFIVTKLDRSDVALASGSPATSLARVTRDGVTPTSSRITKGSERDDGVARAAGPADSDLRGTDAVSSDDGSDRRRDTSKGESSQIYQITMSEGRNRQIRRTFAALGYTVTSLHRTNFGNYALGDIQPGKYQIVDIR